MDWLERLDDRVAGLSRWVIQYICTFLILGQMLYVCGNVFGRYLFRFPLKGMNVYVGLMLIPIAYLGISYAWWRRGTFITINILQNRLKGKVLYGFQLTFFLWTFLVYGGILTYGLTAGLIEAYVKGRWSGETLMWSPQWIWRLPMVIGILLFMTRMALDVIKMIRTKEVIPFNRGAT